jgi:hypothetical protein
MTQDKIDYAIGKMIEWGIVDSGDALELGIGALTEEVVAASTRTWSPPASSRTARLVVDDQHLLREPGSRDRASPAE